MTAVTQAYLPAELLKTPSFFTAAMNANEENPFDQSFADGTDFLDSGPQEYQPSTQLHQDNSGLFLNTSTDSFSPLFDFNNSNNTKSSSQYPNPLYHHQQIPSPPTSAKQTPIDWQFHDFQPSTHHHHHQNPHPTLQNIATQNVSTAPHIHYGQVTPPDDDFANDFSYDDPVHNIPLPPTHLPQPKQPSQSSSSSKGKRTQSTGTSTSTKPTKRTRKSTRSKASSSSSTKSAFNPTNPEDEKRSKFLERNRVAASKCRQKKKEWTSNLETRARELQNGKNQLAMMVSSLKDEMIFLRTEMLKHNGCECGGIRDYLSKEAKSLAQEGPGGGYKSFESAASPVGSAPESRRGSRSEGSPMDNDDNNVVGDEDEEEAPEPESPPMHFKSEDELEALLTDQLARDSSERGIA